MWEKLASRFIQNELLKSASRLCKFSMEFAKSLLLMLATASYTAEADLQCNTYWSTGGQNSGSAVIFDASFIDSDPQRFCIIPSSSNLDGSSWTTVLQKPTCSMPLSSEKQTSMSDWNCCELVLNRASILIMMTFKRQVESNVTRLESVRSIDICLNITRALWAASMEILPSLSNQFCFVWLSFEPRRTEYNRNGWVSNSIAFQ